MEGIINSLKEFVWDIIGYLIPGFTFLVIFNFVALPAIKVENSFLFDWNNFYPYLIIVVSYILGYVIYSITIFKIRNQDDIIFFFEKKLKKWIESNEKFMKVFNKYIGSKHSKYWQESFKNSSTFKSAKSFLKKKDYDGVDNMKLNEIRNILMSRNPKMDEKVYTFMFRSSVFDHLSTILILVSFSGFSQIVFYTLGLNFHYIKTKDPYLALYIIFLLLIPLLGNSKRIFYSISQRVPFSNLK